MTDHRHRFVWTGGSTNINNKPPYVISYACRCGERVSAISDSDEVEGELLMEPSTDCDRDGSLERRGRARILRSDRTTARGNGRRIHIE